VNDYKHKIEVNEVAEVRTEATGSVAGLQVVIGTAPVNRLKDPSTAVNVPIRVRSFEEAEELLGYSDDWDKYTLCPNMYASFKEYGLENVVYINVLDPATHKKENAEEEVQVNDKQAVYGKDDVIRSTVVVKNNETALVEDEDYLLDYNDEGKVVITLLSSGAGAEAQSLKISSSSLDPSHVDEDDIIGGYDSLTGKATGLELIRNVYFKLGLVPALIAAPGWSHKNEVAAVMQLKVHDIDDVFEAMAVIDLDSTTAKVYSSVAEIKKNAEVTDTNAIALWPMVKMNGKKVWYSAVYSAMAAYTAAKNDDIPAKSPSNEDLPIEAAVTADGTEVLLTYSEAAVLNGAGVVTAINYGGWTSWGNNTACYPDNENIRDRYICNRLMANWYKQYFVIQYKTYIDRNNTPRTIENLVDSENVHLNSLTSGGYIAGGKIEYIQNTDEEDILTGHNVFLITIAFWTPTEYILGQLVISEEMLINALTGGEE
jgi:phage tail sheath protein FI